MVFQKPWVLQNFCPFAQVLQFHFLANMCILQSRKAVLESRFVCKTKEVLQCDYSNQGHPTNFPQIKQIKIVEVNNGFQKNYPKWPKICCLCDEQLDYRDNLLENYCKHSQFFSLNLYKILSGGLGWCSPTIKPDLFVLLMTSECLRVWMSRTLISNIIWACEENPSLAFLQVSYLPFTSSSSPPTPFLETEAACG